MSLTEFNTILPLIAAGFYTLLLIISIIRRVQTTRQNRWLLVILGLSLLWQFSLFFEAYLPLAHEPMLVLLASTVGIGLATAVYIEWQPRNRWYLLGTAVMATAVAVDLLRPSYAITLGNVTINSSQFILIATWVALSCLFITKTWRFYQETTFPWHANRLLFWYIALWVIFIGEAVILFNYHPISNIVGHAVRIAGVAGLVYAISSYRIFDVRTYLKRAVAFLVINGISALPLAGAVIAVQQLTRGMNRVQVALLIGTIVILGFFFYQPYRNLVEKLTYRYLLGESVNTSQVVRNYSQAISRTLDVQQLSFLIVSTLSELLQTNRGALMLVTQQESGGFEVDPIPALGRMVKQNFTFPASSLFIQTLREQRQPLLQYDIDFNPAYTTIDQPARLWFKEQSMEAYVPVMAGTALVGIIAIGPKNTAVPYQPGELELVQILADQTVVALQNARLYSELGNQNEHIRDLNRNLIEQNERLEIMDKVKSDFITIASHELRTPLTQVKGYTDILAAMNEENALTREQAREIVGHVNRATLQLESLITAMLDASQLDVDGMQLTFVKTQLDTIIRLATEPLIQAIRERQINLKLVGVEQIPPIQADFKRLVQAFTNVISNAVKYTPDHGAITIEAQQVPSQNGEPYLEIVVSDSGVGIEPKFHDLIFEKFFRIGDPQLHSTGSTKFKGAGPGLGLPIAKGVIEAHGGRIWVESMGEDEGNLPGSRFFIILPMRPAAAEGEPKPESTLRPAYLIG